MIVPAPFIDCVKNTQEAKLPMKCPHCQEESSDREKHTWIGEDDDGTWSISGCQCSSCLRWTFFLVQSESWDTDPDVSRPVKILARRLIRPQGSRRRPCPPQVATHIAEDYREACVVLPDSPKASAALSRRCLQKVLREAAGVQPSTLGNEILELVTTAQIPGQLARSLEAIKSVGDFSSHPMKSLNPGDILPVEPNEANWNLDVLETLFDYYWVQSGSQQQTPASD